jgi:hypothetical protein
MLMANQSAEKNQLQHSGSRVMQNILWPSAIKNKRVPSKKSY